MFTILDERMYQFTPEIVQVAKKTSKAERILRLRRCVDGVAVNTDECYVYRVQDACYVYFGVEQSAFSGSIPNMRWTLQRILDKTDWCLTYYDEDHTPTEIIEVIDDRLMDSGEKNE